MLEIRHPEMINNSATQEAYNIIFSGEGILQRDSFYLWILQLLSPTKKSRLLDISCGQGKLVVLAQQQGFRAIGIDFSADGIRIGKLESSHPGWVVGNGEILPVASHSVDFITHIGSLEHYISPADGAHEIARILKPGGKAAILLPNAYGFFGNILHVVRKGEIFDDGQPLQRYATFETWSNLLTDAGLRILEVVRYDEIPVPQIPKDWAWLFKHPQKILRKAINWFIPKNLSNHFVFICTIE